MNWIKKIWKFITKILGYKFKEAAIQQPVIMPIVNNVGHYIFYCPGCELNHTISTVPSGLKKYHTLSGPLHSPTIKASVLYKDERLICHSFVTDGEIEFLNDTTHHLAGKIVKLEPI